MADGFRGTARFELVRDIGSGGMGRVYEVIDRNSGARVALKRLHATSPSSLLRVRREFRALEEVRHENLVSLFELIEADGEVFFTMELLDGVDLLTHVGASHRELGASGQSETRRVSAQGGAADEIPVSSVQASSKHAPNTVDVERLRTSVVQLARGLSALHASGKVHRDIKPSNIHVTLDGRVVLLDFGLAIAATEQEHDQGADGTRAYMAPEQAAAQHVGPPADLYALGVVLFAALTSELPFRGAEIERGRVSRNACQVRSIRPDAPEDLASLCDSLLVADPELRPTASDVLRRLGALDARPPSHAGPPFVGRTEERRVLHTEIARSRSEARMVAIVGDSGVGKTALVGEILREVALRDPTALILSSRCHERELLSYKAFDGIVDGLRRYLLRLDPTDQARLIPHDAAFLARIFPLLCGVEAFATATEEDPNALPIERRARGFAALRRLLGAIAGERTVVLSIDDLQWTDADSVSLLVDLLREPEAPKVALIATLRPRAADASDLLDQVGAEVAIPTRLRLTPLSESEAREFVQRALGEERSTETTSAIAREGAGHPLFLLALVDHTLSVQARDALGTLASNPAGTTLDDALWLRVAQVDLRSKRVLELMSVAGEPVAESTGAEALALDPAAFATAVHTLRVARLARTTNLGVGIEPYHDRIREMVVARMDGPRQRDLHARLAAALQATGRAETHPHSLVRHLAGAGQPLDAARLAERAAARALEHLAFDQAAELFGAALELGPRDIDFQDACRARLAEALASAGRGPEAAEAYLACAATASAADRVEHRRWAAEHLLRSGHVARGLEVLSGVLAEYGAKLPRYSFVGRATMLGMRLLPRLRALRYELRDPRLADPEDLRRFDAFHAVSISLALVDTARGGVFQSRSLTLALQIGDPLRIGRALALEACYVGSTGERGSLRGARVLVELRRLAEHTGDAYLAGCVLLVGAFLDYHRGAFREGEVKFALGEQAFRNLPGTYFEAGFCTWTRLLLLRNLGHYGKLARFEEWTRDAVRRGDFLMEASIRLTLNAVWLARDDVEGLAGDLDRTTWVPPRVGYHLQHWYHEWARAEIALYERDPSRLAHFRRVVREVSLTFVVLIRIQRAMVRWAFARLLVAQAVTVKSRGLLRQASRLATQLEREEIGYARVWALLVRAAIDHLRGDDEPAVRRLERAIVEAADNGLDQCAHAARWRLAGLVGGDTGQRLRAEAALWARGEKIARMDWMVGIWAPGFRRERSDDLWRS